MHIYFNCFKAVYIFYVVDCIQKKWEEKFRIDFFLYFIYRLNYVDKISSMKNLNYENVIFEIPCYLEIIWFMINHSWI